MAFTPYATGDTIWREMTLENRAAIVGILSSLQGQFTASRIWRFMAHLRCARNRGLIRDRRNMRAPGAHLLTRGVALPRAVVEVIIIVPYRDMPTHVEISEARRVTHEIGIGHGHEASLYNDHRNVTTAERSCDWNMPYESFRRVGRQDDDCAGCAAHGIVYVRAVSRHALNRYSLA